MREILFRGKRKGDKEWQFGHLHIIEWDKPAKAKGDYIDYRILGRHNECSYVDPETVGQYTGLKDKNGVKIFEGDVVEDSTKQELYTVNIGEYNQCKTCFDDEEKAAYGCYTVDSNGFEESIGHAHIWATVIGNIHDDLDLLKEGDGE